MRKKQESFAGRITGRVLVWTIAVFLLLACVILCFEVQSTRRQQTQICYNQMLVTKEYTRRITSDVYVAVTNNVYFIEHSLDKPDSHKQTMERIVRSGTRVRSCGISFAEGYYPGKEKRFCPFAWRNVAHPEVVYSQDMGDADLDYLSADWFLDVLNSDSAQWSEPFYDGYDETTTLAAYMVPIHDPQGRVVAVLGADISLDWLTGKLREYDTELDSDGGIMAGMPGIERKYFIVNYDGSFLTHADGKRIMRDNLYDKLQSCGGSDVETLISNMRNRVESKGPSLERYLVNGEECYVFYTPVKYTKWLSVTAVPCKAIDMLGYIHGAVLLAAVLIAMLLIVCVVYYLTKNGIEPLRKLNRVVNDITLGKYDTRQPDMRHNDEISQLRDSIEEMQYSLSNKNDNGQQKQ